MFFTTWLDMPQNRHAVGNSRLTWRGRHIPYELDPEYDEDQVNIIMSTMKELHDIVGDDCINFRPRIESDRDYVTIQKNSEKMGCFSEVGRNGGAQTLSLHPQCLHKGTIFHELMHTLGFWHEHTRPDRDKYVQILWDNIIQGENQNFIRMDERNVVMLDKYDFYSIMHYSMYAFSKNNLTTIQVSDRSVDTFRIGQRFNLTALDVIKMRKLYNCDKKECQNPGILKYGGISKDDTSIGSSITYKCNENLVLIGPSERICTDNGTWTGDIPVCLDPTKGNFHYCNFDNSSVCGWQGNWTWTSYPTPLKYTGPTWDHTWDSSIGAFIYASGQELYQINTLYMISPEVPNGNVDYCLTFTLSMHGEMMGSLNVSSVACGDTIPLHSWQGDQGDKWNRIKMEVKLACVSESFQVSFEAEKGKSSESDIAIDDVLIADCNTVQAFLEDQQFNAEGTKSNCNFTGTLCNWVQNSDDDFDWTLQSGPTRTFGTGPDCDRTNCSNGYYIYIETSGPRADGDVARLSSFLLKNKWSYCFSFYYNMYGGNIGTLTLLSKTAANETLIWNKTGNQGKGWSKASVEFVTSYNETLVIQATRGRGYRGDIAVDDFELRSGKCRKAFDCDFEEDFCTWKNQNTSDIFDWLRHSGPTNTPRTGPTQDHTSGNGFYIYIETSSPRTLADTARLATDFLSPSSWGYCIRFWLFMYGKDVGRLRLITRNQADNETINWSLTGEQSKVWESFSVFLPASPFETQVIFEGEVGPSYRGDIAIDDVSIQEGNCYVMT